MKEITKVKVKYGIVCMFVLISFIVFLSFMMGIIFPIHQYKTAHMYSSEGTVVSFTFDENYDLCLLTIKTHDGYMRKSYKKDKDSSLYVQTIYVYDSDGKLISTKKLKVNPSEMNDIIKGFIKNKEREEKL